jgi:trehalose 6-phosphate phosphatase
MTQLTRSHGSLVAADLQGAVEMAAQHLEGRPLLVVTDFDGTVSRISNDPWGASILPLGRRALRALAGLPKVHVVVLSGRTARDAAARVRVGGVTYLGNHGMERAFLRRGARAEGLRTQVDDGSWIVETRAVPIQAYFESGFPYGVNQWVSAAGTAWATRALAGAR